MDEKLLCVVTPSARTYYKAIPLAKEFLDKDNNIINSTGTIPDGEVTEFTVSTATIKHFANGKLNGKLEVRNLTDQTITFSEEYENGQLVRVTEHSVLMPQSPLKEEKSTPLYPGTIFKTTKDIRAFYRDGKQIAEETLSANGSTLELLGSIPDGEVKEFGENGKLKTEAVYKNNKLNGVQIRYNEEGKILSKETYEDGILKGPAQYISCTKNSHTVTSCSYKNSILEGIFKVTYPDGTVREQSTYVNGRLEGVRTTYYANASIEVVETFVDGKLQGERKLFFPSGQLWYQENYVNGRLDGERTEFFISGKTRLTELYSEGLLNGSRCLYDEQGNVLVNEEYHWGNVVHNTEYRPL